MEIKSKFIAKDVFIKGGVFRESTDKIQKIFLTLFDMLDKEEIDYIVKVRKDNSIVIAVKENENKNLSTIQTTHNNYTEILSEREQSKKFINCR